MEIFSPKKREENLAHLDLLVIGIFMFTLPRARAAAASSPSPPSRITGANQSSP